MMRRAALLLAALLAVAAFAVTPANAQSGGPGKGVDDDYRSACSPLGLSKTSVSPGESIVVSGTAANPGSVSLVLDGNKLLGTTNAAPFTHAFSTSVTLPNPLSQGSHPIQAFQVGEVAGCADPQVANINVLALTIQAPTQPLARTGSNSTLPLIRFGFGLLAAGGVALLVSRRRRAADIANA